MARTQPAFSGFEDGGRDIMSQKKLVVSIDTGIGKEWIFPRAPGKESSPADSLILAK